MSFMSSSFNLGTSWDIFGCLVLGGCQGFYGWRHVDMLVVDDDDVDDDDMIR